MKAMILAAGEGTRLRPLTSETPKVLLPVGGRPLIEHQFSWLKSHGISQIAINLYHLGDKIKDYLGDGSCFGVKSHYSAEETLLGTAGGVKRIESFFDDTFVVVYGDCLTDFNLEDMIQFHRGKKAIATLALLEVLNPWDVGIVEISKDGKILSFVEKPPRSSTTSGLVNGGVYVLEREIFNYIPDEGFSDFAYDIFSKLIGSSFPVYGYALSPEEYLIDIGTPDNYRLANEAIATGKVKICHG